MATLGAGRYLLGVAELLLLVGFAWLGAARVRSRLLPKCEGAPALLSTAVLALTLLIWAAELLGTVSLFKPLPYLLLVAVAGVALWRFVPQRQSEGDSPQPHLLGRLRRIPLPTLAALLVAAIALTHFAWGAKPQLSGGMTGFDSTWYHGPFAAGFFQTGNTIDLHFIAPQFLAWFYPANGEILHAVGMLAFGRDLLSPLLNVGWFAGCLLASWCIGRPYRVAPWSLALAAVALSVPALSDQAGEARNDIVGIFFLLAAVAIALNASAAERGGGGAGGKGPGASGLPGGALALTGLAVGLAAGTKLNFLLPAAVLVVGLAAIAPRGARWRAFGIAALGALAGGGYWYLRNLVHTGNPLPWVRRPRPDLAAGARPGPRRPRSPQRPRLPRPTARSGPTGSSPASTPASGSSGPCSAPPPSPASSSASSRPAHHPAVPLSAIGRQRNRGMSGRGLVAIRGTGRVTGCLRSGPSSASRRRWPGSSPRPRPPAPTGCRAASSPASATSPRPSFLGLALLPPPPRSLRSRLGIASPERWRGDRGRRAWVVMMGLVALVVAVVLGYPVQRHYLEGRYADPSFTTPGLNAAFAWARDVSGARIATTSTRQYPLFGTDLSNRVAFVGEERPHGGFEAPADCRAYRELLNAGDYDYVVASRDRIEPGKPPYPPQARWTESPQARVVLKKPPTVVFALYGPLDPARLPLNRGPTGGSRGTRRLGILPPSPWTASATSRSSPTSTTASRPWPTASSRSPAPSIRKKCRRRCSTRWTSSASAGSRSRRRRCGSSTRPPTARPTTCT